MIQIDCNYAGGNIIVEEIDASSNPVNINIRQDQRSTAEKWFYWNFKASAAESCRAVFNFTDWEVVGTQGPAVSTDGGATWQYRPDCKLDNRSFFYEFPTENPSSVYFAFCIPYLQSDLERFLKPSDHIERSVLCKSGKGRDVELLSCGPADAKYKILLTARNHACEAEANFVLEGALESLIAAIDGGQSLGLWAVPFVDKDGVEDGDQGKNRNGHDHNRDYIPQPRYSETAAIMALADRIRPQIVIDLHCPWIRGKWNEEIYIVGSNIADNYARQLDLARRIESEVKSAAESASDAVLDFTRANVLPFGAAWNTTVMDVTSQCSCSGYFARQCWCDTATTIEVAYANVAQTQVTAGGLRAFGQSLGRAIVKHAGSIAVDS